MPSRPVLPPISTTISPGTGAQTLYVLRGSRAHHRAQLHMLGDIALVIQLVDYSRGKTYLVAVGGIAVRRRCGDLTLRKFALYSPGKRLQRASAAGYPHRLIHICAAGKRVSYRAAYTGGRAAERLDLGGVIMGLVFEKQQPRLCFSVDSHVYANRAGVYLVRQVKSFQPAAAPDIFAQLS